MKPNFFPITKTSQNFEEKLANTFLSTRLLLELVQLILTEFESNFESPNDEKTLIRMSCALALVIGFILYGDAADDSLENIFLNPAL